MRDRAKVLEKSMFEDYVQNIENNIHKSPKAFWSYVKSKSSSNSYPSIMIYGQHASGQGDDICNMFSNYFYKKKLPSDAVDVEKYRDQQCNHQTVADISSVEVCEEQVLKLLKAIDLSKSAGPDGVPPVVIVKCAKSLSTPLTILYNRSLKEGVIPKIWKTAYITPVHKKGARNAFENYRPISKLCLFAKILEKIV